MFVMPLIMHTTALQHLSDVQLIDFPFCLPVTNASLWMGHFAVQYQIKIQRKVSQEGQILVSFLSFCKSNRQRRQGSYTGRRADWGRQSTGKSWGPKTGRGQHRNGLDRKDENRNRILTRPLRNHLDVVYWCIYCHVKQQNTFCFLFSCQDCSFWLFTPCLPNLTGLFELLCSLQGRPGFVSHAAFSPFCFTASLMSSASADIAQTHW